MLLRRARGPRRRRDGCGQWTWFEIQAGLERRQVSAIVGWVEQRETHLLARWPCDGLRCAQPILQLLSSGLVRHEQLDRRVVGDHVVRGGAALERNVEAGE